MHFEDTTVVPTFSISKLCTSRASLLHSSFGPTTTTTHNFSSNTENCLRTSDVVGLGKTYRRWPAKANKIPSERKSAENDLACMHLVIDPTMSQGSRSKS